jgi:hypothetical protein
MYSRTAVIVEEEVGVWVRLPGMQTVRVCALALSGAQEALQLPLHQVWKDCPRLTGD